MPSNYYLPNLTIEPPPDRSLGKYGLLRLRYLKEHRPVVWAEYVMDGKLYAHLLETEDAANNLLGPSRILWKSAGARWRKGWKMSIRR